MEFSVVSISTNGASTRAYHGIICPVLDSPCKNLKELSIASLVTKPRGGGGGGPEKRAMTVNQAATGSRAAMLRKRILCIVLFTVTRIPAQLPKFFPPPCTHAGDWGLE